MGRREVVVWHENSLKICFCLFALKLFACASYACGSGLSCEFYDTGLILEPELTHVILALNGSTLEVFANGLLAFSLSDFTDESNLGLNGLLASPGSPPPPPPANKKII